MSQPPKWPLRLLRAVCPAYLLEEIEGDLAEHFTRDVQQYGERVARRRFMIKAIRFVRPGIFLRNKLSVSFNGLSMLSSYLKILVRNMRRRKAYAAIHVFGLTAGITFALLIGMFVYGELQVNQNLKDVSRLYMLENKYVAAQEGHYLFSPAPLVKAAVTDYPTLFENYFRFWDRQVTVSKDDKHLRIQSMICDSTLFDMFGFTVLSGNAKSAFDHANAIVVTEMIAQKFFDRTEVAGETLVVATEAGGRKEFMITAVIANTEKRSTVTDLLNMDAQVFIPLANRNDFNLGNMDVWSADIISYVKLTPHANVADASTAMNALLDKNIARQSDNRRYMELKAVKDYYLLANGGAGRKLVLALFAIISFILVLAICNFINISIASSFSRLKEIGVRKVIGGLKRQLLFQFLSESVLLAVLSGVLSIVLYEALRGYFGQAVGVVLPSVVSFSPWLVALIAAGILVIGLAAGAYPAIYLSGTKTIDSLKGKFQSVSSTVKFSRVLVALQFVIATFIGVTALVMSTQVSFFLHSDLGYDHAQVISITSVPRLWSPEGFQRMETAKTEFLTLPQVDHVSLSWGSPSIGLSPGNVKLYKPGEPAEEGMVVTLTSADEHYDDVFGIDMVEGRFLDDDSSQFQPTHAVINQAAALAMSLKTGDKFKLNTSGDTEFTVVGITGNFNYESLRESLKPIVFLDNRSMGSYRFLSFKVAQRDPMKAVEQLEAKWKTVFPDEPFVYSFADDTLASLYKTEYQLKHASEIATLLMIIIVLTGILGLVSLSLSRRTKEIGIRKVLGATTFRILSLFSREYALTMIISFAIALPMAFWFVSGWLESYAYHITPDWWMFALPVTALFLITIAVISVQCLGVARSNPSRSLRQE